MSTWIYLECLDHDPPLVADGESGQHTYNLPQLREDIANRDVLVAAWKLDSRPNDHFRDNTVAFLAGHPKCRLGIFDEYGKRYAIDGEGEDPLP